MQIEDPTLSAILLAGFLAGATATIVYFARRRKQDDTSQQIDEFFVPKIDPSRVPEELRPLIPLAIKFGIGDDGVRVDSANAASVQDRKELRRVFDTRSEEIDAWIASFEGDPMSDEAAAFMYMLLAADELTAFGDPEFTEETKPDSDGG